MNLIPTRKQSSDEWQEGVREENRFRKVEKDIEDLKRLFNWMVIGYVSGIFVLAAIFLFKH